MDYLTIFLLKQILDRSFEELMNFQIGSDDFNHADNGYKPENLKGLGPYYVSEWGTKSV